MMFSTLSTLLICISTVAVASTSTRHSREKRAPAQSAFPLTYNPNFTPTLDSLKLQFDLKFNVAKQLRERGLLGLDLGLNLGFLKVNSKVQLGGSTILNLDLSTILAYDDEWDVAVSRTTNEGNDNAWCSTIQIGTPGQSINLLFDSGSSDLIVYDPTCTTCNLANHTAFNNRLSTTYNSTGSVRFTAAYGSSGKEVKGYTGADVVQIGAVKVTNQPLAIVTEAVNLNSKSAASGLVGIGPDLLSAIPGTRTVFSNMVKQNLIAKPLVGIALVKGTSGQAGNGGEYRFGAINPSYVQGEISYATVTSSFYWGTDFTGVYINDVQVLDAADPPRAIIDTATTLVYLSQASASHFYMLIPGAEYIQSTDTWTVPCDLSKTTVAAPSTVKFGVQGKQWRIPIEDIAFQGIQSGGRCVGGIQGGSESFAILGDVFLKSRYLVLDYGNTAQTAKRIGLADRPDVTY